jgi:photosystem II stability/assembly factor-like uncharacterized protein
MNRVVSLVLALVTLAAGPVFVVPERAAAGPALAGTWEQTGLTEPASEIVTPASGALFAKVGIAVRRSDDAGLTWRTVPEPKPNSGSVPDRFDHTRLYAVLNRTDSVTNAIYDMHRSLDDGASWQTILELPGLETGWRLLLDTAAPGLIYLAESVTTLRRSEDGGDTWTTMEVPAPPRPGEQVPCGWAYRFLPHPSNPDQIFRYAACTIRATHDIGSQRPYQIDRSTDRGQSWATIGQADLRGGPDLSRYLLDQLAGCGIGSQRLYRVNTAVPSPTGPISAGATLDRSDDGGETWTEIRKDEPDNRELFDAAACDPANPDRLYIARQAKVNTVRSGPVTVLVTTDGGQTWADTGLPTDVKTRALALGIDGRYLFAATDKGVWRLQLKE